jgi:hypothetical protein
MTVWAAPLAIHQLNNFGMGQVEIYPNPTSVGFDLKSNCNENCAVKVEVLTLSGQRLLERNCDLLRGNCFVNTDLANGTYMVKITKIETKESVTQKLIITNR